MSELQLSEIGLLRLWVESQHEWGLSTHPHPEPYIIFIRKLLSAFAAAKPSGVAGDWYCEEHPEHLMGHDGCKGAGITDETRVHMLANQLRLARQEAREAGYVAGDLAAFIRNSTRAAAAIGKDMP